MSAPSSPPPAHAQRAADYLHGLPPATQEAGAPYGGRQGVLCYSSFGERSRTAGRRGRLSFREREAPWLQFFITKSVNVMHLHRLVASSISMEVLIIERDECATHLGVAIEVPPVADQRSVVGLQQSAHGCHKLRQVNWHRHELANPSACWANSGRAGTLVSGNQSQSDAVWFSYGMHTRV